jgi:hypothetical protein
MNINIRSPVQTGLETKNDSACKGQQQFTGLESQYPRDSQSCETVKYGHNGEGQQQFT